MEEKKQTKKKKKRKTVCKRLSNDKIYLMNDDDKYDALNIDEWITNKWNGMNCSKKEKERGGFFRHVSCRLCEWWKIYDWNLFFTSAFVSSLPLYTSGPFISCLSMLSIFISLFPLLLIISWVTFDSCNVWCRLRCGNIRFSMQKVCSHAEIGNWKTNDFLLKCFPSCACWNKRSSCYWRGLNGASHR